MYLVWPYPLFSPVCYTLKVMAAGTVASTGWSSAAEALLDRVQEQLGAGSAEQLASSVELLCAHCDQGLAEPSKASFLR